MRTERSTYSLLGGFEGLERVLEERTFQLSLTDELEFSGEEEEECWVVRTTGDSRLGGTLL